MVDDGAGHETTLVGYFYGTFWDRMEVLNIRRMIGWE
jgi:hypothetical protein